MKKLNLFLSLSLSLTLLPLNAWAWGPMGHRIVAEVAYHYLSPEACADVDEILGTHGMVYYSTWPDEIKSDQTFYPTSYDWHFQDLNANLPANQIAYMRTHHPLNGGRLWITYDQLMAQLPNQQSVYTINDEQLSHHDALVFLIHLSGDMLCPMHMAHMDDKGGNTVSVTWLDDETNLHKVWDEKIIESRGFSYTEYAQMLTDKYGQELDSITNLKPEELVQYVYQITQDIYAYQTTWDKNIYHYQWKWKETCDHLLFMAGVLLANNIATIR